MRFSPCYFLFLHFMAFVDSVSVLYQNITNWEEVSRLHWCLPLSPLLLLLGLSSGANPRHRDQCDSFLLFSSCSISVYADVRVLALISVRADASMAFTAPCRVQLTFPLHANLGLLCLPSPGRPLSSASGGFSG